jgi:hypothetical protein
MALAFSEVSGESGRYAAGVAAAVFQALAATAGLDLTSLP